MAALKELACIVIGGASGLGLASARKLVSEGAKVLIADLPSSRGEEMAREMGNNCIFFAADITSENEISEAVQKLRDTFGPVRAAVTTAGTLVIAETLSHTGKAHPLQHFENVMKVNCTGVFNVVRLVAKEMASNEPNINGERGVIINTSSVHAFDGQKGKVAYSGSKGAISAMTLPFARDLSASGIRVNSIAPGMFLTPMFTSGRPDKKGQEAAAKIVPFPQRIASPDDFAHLVQTIIENPTINGEVIRIDGAVRMPYL